MNGVISSLHRALNRPLARFWLGSRFDPIFVDGPSLQWVRMNAEAFRRFRPVDPHEFTHVGMFSFSRAGSHLLESQFHYVSSCFCFGEAHLNIQTDLNWRTFLCRGMYRTDSIQDKKIGDLTHFFYNCNKSPIYLDHPQWDPDLTEFKRKWVLVLRNPLRILLSREATRKKKWLFSEQGADKFFTWFERARTRFIDLLDRRPDDVCVISIEQFVDNADTVMDAAAEKIGLCADLVRSRPNAREFFKIVNRTGEKPVVRNGYLSSPTRKIAIRGWGGEFNPLLNINPDRLYAHDIAASIPAEILRLARLRLGERAFEFYMSDREHRFEKVKANDLLRM